MTQKPKPLFPLLDVGVFYGNYIYKQLDADLY